MRATCKALQSAGAARLSARHGCLGYQHEVIAKCLQGDLADDVLAALQEYPLPVESRATLQNHLVQHGFSLGVASWVTSNLRPSQDDPR